MDKSWGMVDSTCPLARGDWLSRDFRWEHYSATAWGVVALKDNSWKGKPLEISLCHGQKLLHWPCARKWSLSSGCLLSHCHSPSQPVSFLAAPEKRCRVKWQGSSKAPPATGDVELSLQQGSEKLNISSTNSLKHLHELLHLFQKLWVRHCPHRQQQLDHLGFWCGQPHNTGVLDPISSSLDRVIHNSGARVSSLSLYSAVGLEVSLTLPLCEELPLGAEAHHGPTQLHAGWTCWRRANRFPQMTLSPRHLQVTPAWGIRVIWNTF